MTVPPRTRPDKEQEAVGIMQMSDGIMRQVQALDVFKLPDQIQSKVNSLYERDIQRMGGTGPGNFSSPVICFLVKFPVLHG